MKVLVVDDEKNIRESLKKYLSLDNIHAVTAATGEDARDILGRERFDALVLDLKLPGISGQVILDWLHERGIICPVIMISAHGQIKDAVTALKSGARDYLVKPFDPDELVIKLRALVEDSSRRNILEAQNRASERQSGPDVKKNESLLLGDSPVMVQIRSQIEKIAASGATVLITGESGTGKEVAAREIHRLSSHAAGGACDILPFVAVNVGGLPENLAESELFGHEKGSFTGAIARKSGLFELAGSGTIFLDEIGEMPQSLQVKLLRVIQDRVIRHLGGTADIPVAARIVAATNRDMERLVAEGTFREDLYYRLNVIRIKMPPLRARSEDIPLLARAILARLCKRMNRQNTFLSDSAIAKLGSYGFPGNIRELENILERALIYSGSAQSNTAGNCILGPYDIDVPLDSSEKFTGNAGETVKNSQNDVVIQPKGPAYAGREDYPPVTLASAEKKLITQAMERNQGNKTKAAEELGVSRKTIINKLKEYGFE
jgi:two-component system response regulator AtoC